VHELVALTHAAGGLWVADEVQGGHGRTGEAMWSFHRFGIVPDIVTLGKPMGNGHPVAAVITRRDIAEHFAADTVFFSTFGGNQVSVAAAHAVLDVLADERVLPRVVAAGEALRAAALDVCADVPFVGDVRGMGLANAIEIVTDRDTATPDPAMTDRVKNGLRTNGVLVGTTGIHGNVLKVRPPLAFTAAEVPVFAAALAATVRDVVD
jgi:4-aminobutyrate aminotransferase-like enzyme